MIYQVYHLKYPISSALSLACWKSDNTWDDNHVPYKAFLKVCSFYGCKGNAFIHITQTNAAFTLQKSYNLYTLSSNNHPLPTIPKSLSINYLC